MAFRTRPRAKPIRSTGPARPATSVSRAGGSASGAVGPRTIPATEAARRFAIIVDEVRRTGRSVLVTQHGRPVCRIAPPPGPESTVDSLIDALTAGPRADSGFVETVGEIARTQPRLPRSPWDE